MPGAVKTQMNEICAPSEMLSVWNIIMGLVSTHYFKISFESLTSCSNLSNQKNIQVVK